MIPPTTHVVMDDDGLGFDSMLWEDLLVR